MNDFETRLTEALSTGAEQAPDADGLAAGARARARTRRRTRVAVGIGVVVAALAVPVGVLALGGDDTPDGNRVATDPSDQAPKGWHTVEHEGLLVDIPGGWGRLDTSSCEFEMVKYGPSGSDPCAYDDESLNFYASATFDAAHGPGLRSEEGQWAGYVYTGDWAVYATIADLDQARRVLGSARKEGQKAPDLSAGWRTESYGGLAIDVPADWQDGALANWCIDKSVRGRVERPGTRALLIHCSPETGYGIRFGKGSTGNDAGITEQTGPEFPEGSWAGVAIAPDDTGKPIGFVQVVAPTEALAELIGGSLRAE